MIRTVEIQMDDDENLAVTFYSRRKGFRTYYNPKNQSRVRLNNLLNNRFFSIHIWPFCVEVKVRV